jgi:hypothetical protein
MTILEQWELASYIVTVVALPFGLVAYLLDQRKERQNEDDEIYQKLSDEYAEFTKLLLENSDLRLMSPYVALPLNDEQTERKRIMFDIVISLFERAFILLYEDKMNSRTRRQWSSWEDYIHFWFKRPDFCEVLDAMLEGEDPDFQKYMRKAAQPHRA